MKTSSISKHLTKEEIINECLKLLTEKRLIHTLGVKETALQLIKHHVPDWAEENELIEKAEIATYCHDIFRGKKGDDLNSLVRKYNLPDVYLDKPNLAHGKLAVCFMKEELGIEDDDILNAVSYHTTGRDNMSFLEKIVFIADAIEPGRSYPGLEDIRNMAFTDINKACLMSLESTVNHLREQDLPEAEIDSDTLQAINYFKEHF